MDRQRFHTVKSVHTRYIQQRLAEFAATTSLAPPPHSTLASVPTGLADYVFAMDM